MIILTGTTGEGEFTERAFQIAEREGSNTGTIKASCFTITQIHCSLLGRITQRNRESQTEI